MRSLTTAFSALMILQSAIAPAQRLPVHGNINSEKFSNAPHAPKLVADAVVRFQLKEDPKTLDEREEFEGRLQALSVQVGPFEELDYLVKGDGPPFTGADNDWFWLVRMTAKGPNVVLFLHCLNFTFAKSRTNGLLDVSSEWNSPSEELDESFRFNGTRYIRSKHSYKPFVYKP